MIKPERLEKGDVIGIVSPSGPVLHKKNYIQRGIKILNDLGFKIRLGKNALNNVHFHCQGINYSEKGERNHLNLKESDMNYRDLVEVWKEFKLKGIVVCESPNVEKDALLLKETYNL